MGASIGSTCSRFLAVARVTFRQRLLENQASHKFHYSVLVRFSQAKIWAKRLRKSVDRLSRVVGRQAIPNGYRIEVETTPLARDQASSLADKLGIKLSDGEGLSIKCYGQYTDAKE